MMLERQVFGGLRIMVQVDYKRPGLGQELATWSKLVQIHVERYVTLEQAQEILTAWKERNPNCVGTFQAALF
jgi:hypothetical protein